MEKYPTYMEAIAEVVGLLNFKEAIAIGSLEEFQQFSDQMMPARRAIKLNFECLTNF